jgi:hypothetical protein
MQSSLARLMESELNSGEDFIPSGRLSTNGVVENRGEHGDDDLPKVDRS